MSRQEAESLLLSLQQLEKNEAFQAMRLEAEEDYKQAVASVIDDVPVDIKTFLIRERLIGSAKQLKKFLDEPTNWAVDLTQQINTKDNA